MHLACRCNTFVRPCFQLLIWRRIFSASNLLQNSDMGANVYVRLPKYVTILRVMNRELWERSSPPASVQRHMVCRTDMPSGLMQEFSDDYNSETRGAPQLKINSNCGSKTRGLSLMQISGTVLITMLLHFVRTWPCVCCATLGPLFDNFQVQASNAQQVDRYYTIPQYTKIRDTSSIFLIVKAPARSAACF